MPPSPPQKPATPSTLLPSVFSHDDEPVQPKPSTSQRAPSIEYTPSDGELLGAAPVIHHAALPTARSNSSLTVPNEGRAVGIGRDAEDDENDLPYPEPTIDEPLWPPTHFTPFFALVTDEASTAEGAHPHVHYIFSDDDQELIASAAIHAIEAQLPLPDAQPPQPSPNERFILVDLAADGQSVTAARSLTPDWAVTSTSIRPAPTFGGDSEGPDGAGDSENRYMLRIEGTGIGRGVGRPEDKAARILEEARRRAGGDMVAGMEDVMRGLDRGIEVLRKIDGEP